MEVWVVSKGLKRLVFVVVVGEAVSAVDEGLEGGKGRGGYIDGERSGW